MLFVYGKIQLTYLLTSGKSVAKLFQHMTKDYDGVKFLRKKCDRGDL